MGMTIVRWSIGVAAACAAVAALVLPFPDSRPQRFPVGTPAPLAAEVAKLVRASGDAHAAVRRFRSMQALERWEVASARRDTMLIRIDSSVPAQAAVLVRAVAASQWAALAPRASAAHAETFVYLDSSTIARASGEDAGSRVLEPRPFADVIFALPQTADGPRCVAIVRLRGTEPKHLNVMRNQSLTGVCGFFAAFGLPGRGARTWLGAADYRFARRSDWHVARAPGIDASALYDLSQPGARCLTARLGACQTALGVNGATGHGRPAKDNLSAVLGLAGPGAAVFPPGAPTLGGAENEFLADMVRDIGPERFSQFWRSDAGPDAAFSAATGEPLAVWTSRWLARVYGPAPETPGPHARDVVWLILTAVAGLFVAARPRQVVLSERLRPFNP